MLSALIPHTWRQQLSQGHITSTTPYPAGHPTVLGAPLQKRLGPHTTPAEPKPQSPR